MSWTQERIDVLKRLNAEGYSFSEIADRLVVLPPFNRMSRSAVIGKAHRLGISRGTQPKYHKPRRGWVEEPRRVKPKNEHAPTRVARIFANLPKEPLPKASEADVARVSFADLRDEHCKWIPGSPADAGTNKPMFCGAERVPGLPYCRAHAARAYRAPDIDARMAEPSDAGAEAQREPERAPV